jgi:hypothetical protein
VIRPVRGRLDHLTGLYGRIPASGRDHCTGCRRLSATFVFLRANFTFGRTRVQPAIERIDPGIALALGRSVPETPTPLLYAEPTVLWRMQRADGLSTHAVIDVVSSRPALVWYLNGRPLGYRHFHDWSSALRWSDQLQAQNWAVGWRLVSE